MNQKVPLKWIHYASLSAQNDRGGWKMFTNSFVDKAESGHRPSGFVNLSFHQNNFEINENWAEFTDRFVGNT